ncbi:DoxX family protein [Luteimonas huabeiensis]|uniref:DoxX family protein n=1 Tax=Luteimonas huabeiensis TaxID=1244513 RepID=UPI00046607AA|nr:DoxX family protein [Luteimonas huabeiensis]
MPPFVARVLDSPWCWFAARALLVVVFVASGLAKVVDFAGGMDEMRAAGLRPAWLFNAAVAATLLGGSVLVLLDRWLWVGAAALCVFLALTIAVVHRFWTLPEPQATLSMHFALEHLSVMGGLLAAAVAGRALQRAPGRGRD